jgi:hypothetical protein
MSTVIVMMALVVVSRLAGCSILKMGFGKLVWLFQLFQTMGLLEDGG